MLSRYWRVVIKKDKRKLFAGDKVVITHGAYEGCEGEVVWAGYSKPLSVVIKPLYPWPGRYIDYPAYWDTTYMLGTHEVGLVLEEKK